MQRSHDISHTLMSLALSLSCMSCSDDARELLLIINSDLDTPGELDELSVEITASRTPEGQVCEPAHRSFDVDGSALLPFVVAVEPRKEYTSWVAFRVIGHEEGEVVMSLENRITWPASGTSEIEIMLDRRCLNMSCGADAQCVEGGCMVLPTPRVFEDLEIRDVGIPCDANEE